MDLLAYAQIPQLSSILNDIRIDIPRLRGLELCKNMEVYTEDDIRFNMLSIQSNALEDLISSYWGQSHWYCCGTKTKKKIKRYSKHVVFDDYHFNIPIMEKIHGRHRKVLKFEIKKRIKKLKKHQETWDKYCGRDDVIRVHARIGGANWIPYDGPEIEKHPAFLERVDDPWDCTYCNIYLKIR